MRLGLQLSSLKPLLTSAEGVRDAFLRLAEMGYHTLQIQWIDPAVPDDAVRDALAESGLRCVATQDYFEVVEAGLSRVVAQNRLWGSKKVTISGIPDEFMAKDAFRAYVRRVLEMYARLAGEGLALTFHPRAAEFRLIDGMPAADMLMDALPYDVQMTLDLYHVKKAGFDMCRTIARYAGRMDMVHCKNGLTGPDGVETLVPVGQGDIDWKPVFAACKKANVDWAFIEQEKWAGDPYAAMRSSREYAVGLGVI